MLRKLVVDWGEAIDRHVPQEVVPRVVVQELANAAATLQRQCIAATPTAKMPFCSLTCVDCGTISCFAVRRKRLSAWPARMQCENAGRQHRRKAMVMSLRK
eukprot:2914814-Rhodomonas_salina.3